MPRPDQTPPAQYERGPADISAGPQLEQGEAQALNEGLAAVPEGGAEVAPGTPEEAGVQFAPPEDEVLASTGDADEDSFLFEDPGPDEADVGRGGAYGPLPDDVVSLLPDLIEASRDPSAPPQLTLLVQLLSERLGA